MKFEKYDIDDSLKQGLDELGFTRATDIQFKAIPSILAGEDVLAIAHTGTGKTAAFIVPTLNKILNSKKRSKSKHIRCVIMVPTRELALQINKVIIEIGRYAKIRSHAIFGGVSQDPQIATLNNGVDILVCTPGRMFDLISQGHIDLSKVETLILDEADHMLDLGFYKDIEDVLRHLPFHRQTLFFSATINQKIKKLAYSIVTKPIRIQLSPLDPVSKNIKHLLIKVEMDDKRFFLERLIKEHPESKVLIFVRTKVRAERVMKAMERVDIVALTMHGDKEQEDRFAILNKFRSGEIKVLIATDVSARGIDIPNVEYVVNYDLPDVAENYVHRIGRTGRGTNKGLAYTFCSSEELDYLAAVEEFLGHKISEMEIDRDTYKEVREVADPNEINLDFIQKMVDDMEVKKTRKK